VFHQADNLAIESALSRTLGQLIGLPGRNPPARSELPAGRLLAGLAGQGYLSICRCIYRK